MATEKKKKKAEEKPKVEAQRESKTAQSKGECGDRNCPAHGSLSVRGSAFDGVVVSDKMRGTVVVLRETMVRDKKYERYFRSRSKISAHNPPCIMAKTGDKVKIMECRRLSKTVSFVVVEKQNG